MFLIVSKQIVDSKGLTPRHFYRFERCLLYLQNCS